MKKGIRTAEKEERKLVTGVARGITVGLDLGDRKSHYCVLDADGTVIEEGQTPNTVEAFSIITEGWQGVVRVAMEAGTQSAWISQLYEELGQEVLVIHSRDLWGEGGKRRKNDRRDAELIARKARFDPQMLKQVQHRDAQTQLDLGQVRARDALVRARTQLVNAARGIAKVHNERLPKASHSGTFGKRARREVSPTVAAVLAPLLIQIDEIAARIDQYDRMLVKLVEERYPAARHLAETPSVGVLTALTFVLTLYDPARFRHSREVGVYVGLTPGERQSGDSNPQLGISKAGNPYLRKLLVQCAHHTLGRFGKDSALRRWGLLLAERGGRRGRKRAVVAVARKLAVLLHRLWVTGAAYDPFYQEPAASGSRVSAA